MRSYTTHEYGMTGHNQHMSMIYDQFWYTIIVRFYCEYMYVWLSGHRTQKS